MDASKFVFSTSINSAGVVLGSEEECNLDGKGGDVCVDKVVVGEGSTAETVTHTISGPAIPVFTLTAESPADTAKNDAGIVETRLAVMTLCAATIGFLFLL